MTNKEHVQMHGGKFNIFNGETWTMPNGHVCHFVLNPKFGARGINIVVGFHEPGKEFAPHVHPISDETLLIYGGEGECFLEDKWIPCKAGDIIYAPAGVAHGTRNYPDAKEPFVTLGIATPPQLDLYNRFGYDVLDDDTGEYTGDVAYFANREAKKVQVKAPADTTNVEKKD